MDNLFYLQILVWLLPILFIFHDFEEIIMVEKWMERHSHQFYKRLPKRLADRVMRQFSLTTAQFALAVLIMFLFVSSSAILANQYLIGGPYATIYPFTIIILVFFIHAFTHIGQSIFFKSITPGAVTSVIIILPYSYFVFPAFMENGVITWNIIYACLPFTLLLLPIVLLAHWVGKKVG